MKMRFWNGLLSIILSASYSQSGLATSPISSTTDKFISVSDIHFDPFSTCTSVVKTCDTLNKLRAADYKEWDEIFIKDGEEQFSKVGTDTNYPLFASTIETLLQVSQEQHPKFGLVLGDFFAHNFRAKYIAYSHDTSIAGYQAFVKKTLQFITYKLHDIMPDIDIYPVVGNNDSYHGDYYSAPYSAFYHDTAQTWSELIKNPANKKQLLSEFPGGGYYVVTLPNTQDRLILLNTILFSAHANGEHINATAKQELSWLHNQLELAAQQKQHVLIAFHIPFGIDVYTTIKNKFSSTVEYWKPQYQKVFLDEVRNYSAVIVGILPGHIHMDTFQMIKTPHKELPVSGTPAISPIFGNNPGFKVYSYDTKSAQLENFDTYYLPMRNDSGWQKEYSFNQIYQPQCSVCDLVSGMQQVTPTNHLAEYFKQYYALGNNAQPITQQNDWVPYYWCNLREVNVTGYRKCVRDMRVG